MCRPRNHWTVALSVIGIATFYVTAGVASSITTTVQVGTNPAASALNPQTGEVVIVNQGSASASVVDGRTHLVSNVPTGAGPIAVAVNALTGYAYVANSISNDITVIYGYGEGKKRMTVSAGLTPWSIAVNPRTNLIYVCTAVA